MDPALTPPPRDVRWRRWRHVVTVVATAAALAGLGGAATWWTHPQAFDASDLEWRAPTEVGRTMNVSLQMPSRSGPTTDLHAVTPRVAVNTAGADVAVTICTTGDVALGTSRGPLPDASCPSTRPIDSGTVDWRTESLVVQVTPRRAGTVRIEGAEILYSRDARHLWQTGTQLVGATVVVTTP